jgi:hypothetical protein
MPRTLKQVDDDLKIVRGKLMDSVRESDRWKTSWLYLDKLLDERLEITGGEYLTSPGKDLSSEVEVSNCLM